ncbi:MAG: carboxypeptidase-like regulatory domain-containing protein [Planctomycetota bacterium]
MSRAHSTLLGILACAVALALAGAVMFVLNQSSEPSSPGSTRAEPRARETSAPGAQLPIEAPSSDRAAVPASEDEAPPLRVVSVRGRVVDASGAPVPGIQVGILGEDRLATSIADSDGAGSFQLAAAELPCYVDVVDREWTTLRRGEVTAEDPLVPALVIAARAANVSGVVVDPQGRPLAGAHIQIAPRRNALLESSGRGVDGEWHAASSDDGSFTVSRAPMTSGARISTRLSEYAADDRTLDLPPPEPLRIVLAPVPREGPLLTGTVVRADGSAVSGATVSFGSARARSDIRGRFRLVCGWYDASTPLVAAARKSSPEILEGYGSRVECNVAERPPETIVLPEAPSSITGRVLLANGTPAKGWRVALADPTPLDPGGASTDFVEGLIGDRLDPRTDGSGAFELQGLLDRSYTLLAFGRDRSSGAEVVVRSEPVPAGSRDVVLEATGANPGAAISGRVLAASGEPIEGARIGLGRPYGRGSGWEHSMQGRFRAASNAEGWFEILGVPEGLAFLVVAREGFQPIRLALETGSSRSNLALRLREQRQFSFNGSASSPQPDLLRALSAGKPVSSWRLDGGISGPIAVDEDVREVALYRGCLEIARVPLALAPGGTTLVVWP